MTILPGGYKDRIYYQRLVEQKCPRCGGNRDDFYITCSKCRKNQSERWKNVKDIRAANTRRRNRQRARYKRDGLCQCSRPLEDNRYYSCEICRERNREHKKQEYKNKKVGVND